MWVSMGNNIFIELGGNQGDRVEFLTRALYEIEKTIGKIIQTSSLYETPPWGFKSDDAFLNQVIELQSDLNSGIMMQKLHQIELQLGRVRGSNQYMSRTIDLDVLFYGQQILKSDVLEIPHPRLHLRRFVLEPMAEIAPDFIHPVFKKNISQLLMECVDNSVCKKMNLKF
jgi:2-amino-4-hydroxy-6-hydroxymethyldihydropteridine diphosphokinase